MSRELGLSGNGVWLLARLATHHSLRRVLAKAPHQEPLPGLAMTHRDQLEVARITLALAEAKGRARHPARDRRRPG